MSRPTRACELKLKKNQKKIDKQSHALHGRVS